ncbi:MAG: hypothetical protein N2560_09560 [Ignavibacteria bacterium]|nr:hypothetical protein [Ignavibacteria bacterium]
MKKILFFLVFLGFATILYALDSYIERINASSNGKDITIEFKTINEKNISFFEIERSINNGNFKKITSILAKGYPSTYKYTDQEAFLKDNNDEKLTATSYSYRIKILFKDNTYLYSNSVNVSHKVNGIYRTWGMIKEMFR